MSYLLDTNACVALISGSPQGVRVKFDQVTRRGEQVCLSAISMFELWHGVFKSARPDFNAQRLSSFLKRSIEVLAFEDDDAKAAGNLRAELELIGTPVGAYDLLLAAQACNRGLTLITANISELAQVKNLDCQNWSG